MGRVKQFGLMMALSLAVVACGAQQQKITQIGVDDAGKGHDALKGGGEALRDTVEQFVTRGTHHTVTRIDDITDPAHPMKVYEVAGNLLGECGVRAMLASLLANDTGTVTTALWLGASSGAADTLGTRCAGLDEASHVKFGCPFDITSRIAIGAGSAGTCTAAGTPWACCTGNGTGCAINNLDIVTFAEGQPNGSLTGVGTNYASWVSGGKANVTFLTMDSNYPTLYWNGSGLQGIQFRATAGSSTANQQWCEYGVRTQPNAGNTVCTASATPWLCCTGTGTGTCSHALFGNAACVAAGNPWACCTGSTTGTCSTVPYCAAVTDVSNTTPSGWQLNHAVISPCLTKSSGQTFQLTITITLS